MEENKKVSFGALPPSGMGWQIGKTAATVKFVNEAEKYLVDKPEISPIKALQQYVVDLKSGKFKLEKFVSVEEYMNSFPINCMG